MCYKLNLIVLVVAVLAIVSVQPCTATPGADDSFNYWYSYRSWQAPWEELVKGNRDVSIVSDSVPAPTGEKIELGDYDTHYGQTAAYSINYRETGPGAGFASIRTSATYGIPDYDHKSSSQAGLNFGINLTEDKVLHFVYGSVGYAGSAGSIPRDQLIPAGPPSQHQFHLYASSINGGTSASVSLVWGPVGHVPGQSPTNPLPTGTRIEPASVPASATVPSNDPGDGEPICVTGTHLTGVPVGGDYGYAAPTYFGETPASVATPLERAARGYGFISQGLNITSFVLPGALPNGDSQFELLVGGKLYSVSAGSVFDFTSLMPSGNGFAALAGDTSLFPNGVESFALLGIDPSEGFDPTAAPPFPVGLQFAGEGLTQLYTLSYGPVPEPTSVVMFVVGALGLIQVEWRRRNFRRNRLIPLT